MHTNLVCVESETSEVKTKRYPGESIYMYLVVYNKYVNVAYLHSVGSYWQL